MLHMLQVFVWESKLACVKGEMPLSVIDHCKSSASGGAESTESELVEPVDTPTLRDAPIHHHLLLVCLH